MRKFDVRHEGLAPIEIAQAFEQPNTAYLNRCALFILIYADVLRPSSDLL